MKVFFLHYVPLILFLSQVQGGTEIPVSAKNDARDVSSQTTQGTASLLLSTEKEKARTGRSQTTEADVRENGTNSSIVSLSASTEEITTEIAATPGKPHSNSDSTSATPGSTSPKEKDAPSRRPIADPSRVQEHNRRIFFYDYKALRIYGLIFSAVLFTLGILIMTCGRCKKCFSCRRTDRRKYNVRQL